MNANKMFGEKIEKNIRYNKDTDTYYVQFNFSAAKTARLRGFPTLEDARTYRDAINAEKLAYKIKMDVETIHQRELKEIKKITPYPFNVFEAIDIKKPATFLIENFDEFITRNLNPREADFIVDFFHDKDTLQKIGDKYGISRERVRQVISCALNKLKSYL